TEARLRAGCRKTEASPVSAMSRRRPIGVALDRERLPTLQRGIGEEGGGAARTEVGAGRDWAALVRARPIQPRVEAEGAPGKVHGRPEAESAHQALERLAARLLLRPGPALLH